jgi:hypothetical protein
VLNIRKNGILCQAKKATRYARNEGKFCQVLKITVLKITITERNLASWSKPIRQRFQEGRVKMGLFLPPTNPQAAVGKTTNDFSLESALLWQIISGG